MTKQLGFHFDSSVCTGCKACQIACKDKNNLPVGVIWRRVYQYGGGTWVADARHKELMVANNVFSYSISAACMHCADPVCVKVCPTTAMHKDENGVVSIDADQCIGCRYCEWACPYGAPQFNEAEGIMTKCNFCQDLLAEGGNPACVDACPMRALDFGQMDDLRAKYGTVNAIEPMPSGDYTDPSLVITPHKNAERVGAGTGHILNLAEEI